MELSPSEDVTPVAKVIRTVGETIPKIKKMKPLWITNRLETPHTCLCEDVCTPYMGSSAPQNCMTDLGGFSQCTICLIPEPAHFKFRDCYLHHFWQKFSLVFGN